MGGLQLVSNEDSQKIVLMMARRRGHMNANTNAMITVSKLVASLLVLAVRPQSSALAVGLPLRCRSLRQRLHYGRHDCRHR
jgi:hypothetical protein